jgi:hypothetical protein
VADRADWPAEVPEPGDSLAQHWRAEALAHARGVAAGQQQGVKGGRVQAGPGRGRAEGRIGGEGGVAGPCVGRSSEAAEDHSRQQPWVGGRGGRRPLGREGHLAPGVAAPHRAPPPR